MNTRRIASIVGILFIMGTIAGIGSVVLSTPIMDASDYLLAISGSQDRMVTAVVCILTMGFSLSLVPIVLYPLLKQSHPTLAIGYVVFRGGLETFMYLFISICWLLLIAVSQMYADAGAVETVTYQSLGTMLQDAGDIVSSLTAVVFPIGAVMFYYMLYQTKLVPRWLSVWGLIAVILHLISTGILGLYGRVDHFSTSQFLLNFPIFLQEMVMAVWLIAKGFEQSTIVQAPFQASISERQKVFE